MKKNKTSLLVLVLIIALATVAAGCGDGSSKKKVVVGSKNFTESLLLGEMFSLALEDAGIKVERKLNLGGTLIAHEALKKGDIDVYPEYTGTGLLNILNEKPLPDPKEVYDRVSDYYKKEFNLVWLDPSQANNTQAIAISRAASEKYGITTLSELQAKAGEINFAAVPEFEEREDGLLGMNRVYGDFKFKSLKLFDYGVKYRVVLSDEAQATIAFGTDGELLNPDLVVLKDDKQLWPPYNVAPVIRQKTLDQDENIATILNKITAKLDDPTLQKLNAEVDINKKEYKDVAKQFLKDSGLIK
ncbi:ABC transporter substrate-binding protein [Paenibacillus radicis (ex Gao et al. 2016)]|uniref:Glycine/betaine ABC transporter substrate-binding protein n=1 Tax=Paenibacillus radicis (ex Gao et al. 2016) TaxID=1737354 RepID=A0A917LYL4_9BACL|nr:glycine betaine ABC transporter substrate-binding protein [Paenibacillus radicis (ex Gao et al. 2016)]GGG67354.1 glycine/betaine ABC transporter substrate-binding protein [Paenibacillus radicis (ex Gao et al. 2016)]